MNAYERDVVIAKSDLDQFDTLYTNDPNYKVNPFTSHNGRSRAQIESVYLEKLQILEDLKISDPIRQLLNYHGAYSQALLAALSAHVKEMMNESK